MQNESVSSGAVSKGGCSCYVQLERTCDDEVPGQSTERPLLYSDWGTKGLLWG